MSDLFRDIESRTPDAMPQHKPIRFLIECSCGRTVDQDRYERHRSKEAGEVGRWIADRMLNNVRAVLRTPPPVPGEGE